MITVGYEYVTFAALSVKDSRIVPMKQLRKEVVFR